MFLWYFQIKTIPAENCNKQAYIPTFLDTNTENEQEILKHNVLEKMVSSKLRSMAHNHMK